MAGAVPVGAALRRKAPPFCHTVKPGPPLTRATTWRTCFMSQAIVVAALYKFVTLQDYVELREPLLKAMLDNQVKGTLLLAHEGINGTVSATREGIDGLLAWLRSDHAWSMSTIKSRTATNSRSTAPRSSSRKRSSPSACPAWTPTRPWAPTSSPRTGTP